MTHGGRACRPPLALTVEEWGVMAEWEGTTPPTWLTSDLDGDELLVAGIVATRSLVASGAAEWSPEGLRTVPDLRDWVAPLLDPEVAVAVELFSPYRSRHVLAEAGGRVAVAHEREPGVWVADVPTYDRELDALQVALDAMLEERPGSGAVHVITRGLNPDAVSIEEEAETEAALGRLFALLDEARRPVA